jgi:hypothetical protein
MAVSNLVILNSSYVGSRDLYWADDFSPGIVGYNLYRAYDAPTNWSKINPYPHPGHFYRDETTLTTKTHTVIPSDWLHFGRGGQYVIKLPDVPIWGGAVKGRPSIAAHPTDVSVTIDGVPSYLARVDGQEGLVYLPTQETAKKDGSVSAYAANPFAGTDPSAYTVVVTYKTLTNFVDIYISGTRTFYTVVPVMGGGQELHMPGAPGTEVKNSMEIEQMDYIYAEMVRRNAFLFEQVGEPADLLIRRTKGEPCGCTVGNGEPRSGCSSCYGTGIIGGYFGPFQILYLDPDTALTTTLDEGGRKVERESQSHLGPTPVVQSGDLIVRRNGDRVVIKDVTYKSPRGVLLQQDFQTELLQARDTRYLIPLIQGPVPQPTIVYDPRFVETRQLPAEPITDPLTDPTKTWENPIAPRGRTVPFGNIQT